MILPNELARKSEAIAKVIFEGATMGLPRWEKSMNGLGTDLHLKTGDILLITRKDDVWEWYVVKDEETLVRLVDRVSAVEVNLEFKMLEYMMQDPQLYPGYTLEDMYRERWDRIVRDGLRYTPKLENSEDL